MEIEHLFLDSLCVCSVSMALPHTLNSLSDSVSLWLSPKTDQFGSL